LDDFDDRFMSVLLSIGLAFGLMGALFFVSWLWAKRIDNYSLVDAVWAFGIGLTGVFWLSQSASRSRHWVAGALIVLWSVRLGGHLAKRIWKHHPHEDARYQKLRQVWQGRVPSSFFWFFQAQAFSAVFLAVPFLWIGRDPASGWGLFEWLGLGVLVTGIAGEGIADLQMSRFKEKNHDSSAVCEEGLWNYSRHPNYFFEALIWVGFYLFACGSPFGWVTVYVPATMIYLLLCVTGIPPTEAAAVLRKGDAYRRYQQTTSPFVPLPKRRIS
jgi:steroid 5-alpha reductase family enzyme